MNVSYIKEIQGLFTKRWGTDKPNSIIFELILKLFCEMSDYYKYKEESFFLTCVKYCYWNSIKFG